MALDEMRLGNVVNFKFSLFFTITLQVTNSVKIKMYLYMECNGNDKTESAERFSPVGVDHQHPEGYIH